MLCIAMLAGGLVATTLPGRVVADPTAAGEPAGPAVPNDVPSLVGSWYVLVHYRDRVSEDPDQVLWRDEMWRFEPNDRGLLWSVDPSVDLRDGTGRFEELGDERLARTLGAWEPNERQLEEIRRGLALHGEDIRSKQLRGSALEGYVSAGSLHSASSSMIGYHESWRVDPPLSRPTFSRVDAMGSGRTTGLSGATRYTTRDVRSGGLELRGDYERDGELLGDFRMLRMEASVANRRTTP